MYLLRRHEQKTLIIAGSRLSHSDATDLGAAIAKDPDDISGRFKLIGFYNNHLPKDGAQYCGIPDTHFQHLRWLIDRVPELPRMSGTTQGEWLCDRDQLFELYKTWLNALEHHPHSQGLLRNAVSFLADCRKDPELLNKLRNELQLISDMSIGCIGNET